MPTRDAPDRLDRFVDHLRIIWTISSIIAEFIKEHGNRQSAIFDRAQKEKEKENGKENEGEKRRRKKNEYPATHARLSALIIP
jgi:hypothetical protein